MARGSCCTQLGVVATEHVHSCMLQLISSNAWQGLHVDLNPTPLPHTTAIAGVGLHVPATATSPSFIHRMLLSAVHADTPAGRKLALWLAHNAYRGCGWCWLLSVRSEDGVNFWPGYCAPVPYGVHIAAQTSTAPSSQGASAGQQQQPPALKALAGDTFVTDQQQRERGAAVAAGTAEATCYGCHGPSFIVDSLPYLTYDVFLMPIAHACLLGVLKDFLNLIFADGRRGEVAPWWRIPSWARKIIAARAAHVRATDDFGRGYSCVVNARGSWVMENYLHFLETFSVYIFAPHNTLGDVLPDERLRKMWGHLRNALLTILRPLGGLHKTAVEAAKYAQAELKEYGKYAEKDFGRWASESIAVGGVWDAQMKPRCRWLCCFFACLACLAACMMPSAQLNQCCSSPLPTSRLLCKYNLHQLVCRLVRQAGLRGHSSNYSELWGEVYIQYCKSATKYRSTACPELVIVKTLLVDAALANLSVLHPEHTRTFDQLVPKYRSGQMRGKNIDTASSSSDTEEEHERVGVGLGAAATTENGGLVVSGSVGAASGVGAAMRSAGGSEEDEGSADAPLLLGSGKALKGEELARVERSVRARLEDRVVGWPPLVGWHAVWLDGGSALAYQHADQGGGGFSFKSVAYTRATQRVSYFALVRYMEGDALVPYVAKVHYFVKLVPTSREAAQAAARQLQEAAAARAPPAARGRGRGGRQGRHSHPARQRTAAEEAAMAAERAAARDPPSSLRVALCDLYKAHEVSNWRGTGYYVRDMKTPWKADVPLPLDELTQKVVVCSHLFDRSTQRTGDDTLHTAWFITFENLSRTTIL